MTRVRQLGSFSRRPPARLLSRHIEEAVLQVGRRLDTAGIPEQVVMDALSPRRAHHDHEAAERQLTRLLQPVLCMQPAEQGDLVRPVLHLIHSIKRHGLNVGACSGTAEGESQGESRVSERMRLCEQEAGGETRCEKSWALKTFDESGEDFKCKERQYFTLQMLPNCTRTEGMEVGANVHVMQMLQQLDDASVLLCLLHSPFRLLPATTAALQTCSPVA